MAQHVDDHCEIEKGKAVVKANVEERQAVEVRPMRYVLGVGVLLVIIGFVISYLNIASFT